MYLYINTFSVFDISAVFLMFLFSMQSQAEMYCKCIQNPIFLRILLMFEYFLDQTTFHLFPLQYLEKQSSQAFLYMCVFLFFWYFGFMETCRHLNKCLMKTKRRAWNLFELGRFNVTTCHRDSLSEWRWGGQHWHDIILTGDSCATPRSNVACWGGSPRCPGSWLSEETSAACGYRSLVLYRRSCRQDAKIKRFFKNPKTLL